MNILYVTEFFPPERTAGAHRAYFVSEGLSQIGHNITILTTYPNFPRGKRFKDAGVLYNKYEHLKNGAEVMRFPIIERPNTTAINRLLMYLSFFISGFFFFLFHMDSFKKKKFDVVIGTSGPIFVPWLAWWIGSALKIKLVIEYRDLSYLQIKATEMSKNSFVNKIFKKIELFPAYRANAIVVLTKGFKKILQIEERILDRKIFVITNGTTLITDNEDKLAAKSKLVTAQKDLVICYLGTFGVSQNLMRIIETMKLLRDKPVRFLLVGDGAERDELQRKIVSESIANVEMRGSVPRKEINRIYNICDLCLVSLKCNSNFSATIPSKIFDIMGHKKPILFVGPTGEASDIITKANAGVIISKDDPIYIASTIKQILKHNYRDELLQMGQNGYNFVVKNYNWHIISKGYEDVLLNL